MKNTLRFVIVASLTLVLNVGCKSLLENKPNAASYPASLNIVDTNQVNAVAWLQAASALNHAVNPTPTQEPIGVILTALTTIAATAAGFYGRAHAGKQAVENAAKVAEAVKNAQS